MRTRRRAASDSATMQARSRKGGARTDGRETGWVTILNSISENRKVAASAHLVRSGEHGSEE